MSTSLVLLSVKVKNTFIEGYCDNAPSSEDDDDETRLSDGSFVPRLVRSTSEPDMMTIKLMEQSTSPLPLTSQTMGDLPSWYQPDEEFDEDSEQASGDSDFSRQVSSTIGDKGPTTQAGNGPCFELVPQTGRDQCNGWTISMDSTEPSTSGEKSPSSESDNGGLGNGENHSPNGSANGDAEKQGYWVMPANSALMAHCARMAYGQQIHGPSHCGPNMSLQTPELADASMHSQQNIGKSRQGRGQKPRSMIDIAAAKNLHHQQVRHPKQPEVNAKASKVAEADSNKKGSEAEATPSHSMPRVPRFCPYCGAPSRADFKFCGYCGAGLDH